MTSKFVSFRFLNILPFTFSFLVVLFIFIFCMTRTLCGRLSFSQDRFLYLYSSIYSLLSLLSLCCSAVGQYLDAQPNRILLVTIHHMLYPITVDVLHQVFSPHGFVEKMVTFQKSAGQLLQVFCLFLCLCLY
jgi:hypothetical protein